MKSLTLLLLLASNVLFANEESQLDQIDRMTAEVVRQIALYEKQGTVKWDYKIATTDMAVQVGSLTKLILQLNGQRFAHGMTKEDIKSKVADELTDIMSLVLFISHELGIDMKDAWQQMLKSNDVKFKKRIKNHEQN